MPVLPPAAAKTAVPARAARAPATPPSAGLGGQEHKYLQSLIQRFGEDRGFRASVEHTVLDGVGAIDVALEREGLRIAVEITVTTPTEHEIGNIHKCLAAGHDQVWLVAETKAHKRLNAALDRAFEPELRPRARCTSAEEISALLDALALLAPKVETVAGFNVKVSFSGGDAAEQSSRAKTVREVIARSMRRQKGG